MNVDGLRRLGNYIMCAECRTPPVDELPNSWTLVTAVRNENGVLISRVTPHRPECPLLRESL